MTSNVDRCRAIQKSDGERCPNPAKFAGFCGRHYPKIGDDKSAHIAAKWPNKTREALKVAGELAGAIGLIELLVRAWQCIAMGSGPRMPSDYNHLQNAFGPSYPRSPPFIIPATNGAEDINWPQARKIFDKATSAISSLEAGEWIDQSIADNIIQEAGVLFEAINAPNINANLDWLVGDESE